MILVYIEYKNNDNHYPKIIIFCRICFCNIHLSVAGILLFNTIMSNKSCCGSAGITCLIDDKWSHFSNKYVNYMAILYNTICLGNVSKRYYSIIIFE